jgi:hypothetical protein
LSTIDIDEMKIKKLSPPVVVNFTNKLDKDFCNRYCPSNISVPGCQSKIYVSPGITPGLFLLGHRKKVYIEF